MNVEQLRKFALALPYVTEDVKWKADLCFCIGAKMFCVTGLEQPVFKASFKVLNEEFNDLIEKNGIIPAPYLARYKWVLADNNAELSDNEWENYVCQSYELVKAKLPKKILRELENS